MSSSADLGPIARRLLEARAAGSASPLLEVSQFPDEGAIDGLVLQLRDREGELRCSLGATRRASLAEDLRSLAEEAWEGDPRFPPLQADELPDLLIELWTLGPGRSMRSLEELDPERHAVRVRSGLLGSLLLPDVARERGWEAHATIAYARHLAGLRGEDSADDPPEILLHDASCFRS